MNTPTKAKELKRGEFTRFKDTENAPVWKFEHRHAGRCYFSKCDDMNKETSKSPETVVFIGFTY